MYKLDVTWQNVCYCCYNPLDIKCIIRGVDSNFVDAYLSFCGHRPFRLTLNISFYKFFGTKVKKVCYACYCTLKLRCKHKFIMNHEIGKNASMRYPVSVSKHEIYDWFYDFTQFLGRKDLDQCLLPMEDQNVVCGLRLLLI